MKNKKLAFSSIFENNRPINPFRWHKVLANYRAFGSADVFFGDNSDSGNSDSGNRSANPDIKPCPFCESKNIAFVYTSHYGHGDCGFTDGRMQCQDCGCSFGNLSEYGEPSKQDKDIAIAQWNSFANKLNFKK